MDELVDERDQRLERALEDVAAGRGPASEYHDGLSHLIPEELPRFEEVWKPLSEQQKLALLDVLSREESESLRLEFNAIYHLGMLDSSPAVRQRAIEATIEDEGAWLLERLLTLLVSDDEADVRAAAAAGLQTFAQRAEVGDLHPDDTARMYRTLLETYHRPGERLDVRAEALSSLGYFNDEVVRRELAEAFRDEALRLHAVRGMGHSLDPQWLDLVLGLLDDSDDVLRKAAATAAGELGEERAVPALIEMIDDPALSVRLAAIAALGEIGGDEAREALVYALQDRRGVIREAATAAIEELDFMEDPLAP